MSLPVYCRNLNSKYDVFTASRHIDILTYNRILNRGWENLTDRQREIVSIVCEHLAIFELENSDVINSVLSSYSIDGISVNYNVNGLSVIIICGVVIKRADYELLKSTGLCNRVI